MTPERLREIERLFHEARERPPAERDAFLARACADDSALRREVESLLAQPPAGLIDAPVGALVAGLVSPASVLAHRPAPRRLRGAGTAGRRRDGRSVPRARHAAGPRRRDQDPAARVQGRSRPAGPLRTRGAGARLAQSSAHRRDLRAGGCRRRHRPRDGARRGRGSLAAHRARGDPDRRGPADRTTDRRGPRSGARAGHHPPGSEAREHQGAAGRHGEGARFRAGQSARPDRPRRARRR